MVFSLLLILGCSPATDSSPVDETDEPVFIDDGTITLGFYTPEDVFEPLTDGDPCWVIDGIQGGNWTMPVVRVGGLAELVTVTCTVDTETERVGETHSNVRLTEGPTGGLEYPGLPIPILPENGDVEALYGLTATLTCTVVDQARHRAQGAVSVVLEHGFDPDWSADTDG